MRFVAFLRGVNVGGRMVKKETLQQAFAQLGFEDVATFKQSGNVIFEANAVDVEKLRKKIEAKLENALGFNVPTILRTIEQLKRIVELEPFKGQNPEGSSFLVTLLPNPVPVSFASQLPLTIPKSTAQVIGASGTEVYSMTHGDGEGALPNPFVESRLKVKATTRNLNILKEIVEKYCA